MESILNSVKKVLGIAPEYIDFDTDIILHINSAFSTLHQLGVGPVGGFAIEDDSATWDSLLGGDDRFNSVKQYVYLKVRLIFDPPQVGYVLEALNRTATELEWRINVLREGDIAGAESSVSNDQVFDGGTP